MKEMNEHFKLPDGTTGIRHGTLPEIKEPKPVKVSASIAAPLEYLRKRGELIPIKESSVMVNRMAGSLELYTNEHGVDRTGSPYEARVMGAVKENPHLKALGLYDGTGEPKNLEETRRLVSGLRFLFKDRDNSKLLKSLEDFRLKRETELVQKNDKKGSGVASYSTKVMNSDDIVFNFTLVAPVYVGCKPIPIPCELCLSVEEHSVRFWIESPALRCDAETIKDELIDGQIDLIKKEFPELAIFEG
jgi:hypothetical protein